ncbi:hypothetical protein TNCV_4540071 [Trichonephila clavipes]|nr:hypothetical protein TNCV_4540071 [Trichonephila clavipes]
MERLISEGNPNLQSVKIWGIARVEVNVRKNLEASCFVSCDENLTLPTGLCFPASREGAGGRSENRRSRGRSQRSCHLSYLPGLSKCHLAKLESTEYGLTRVCCCWRVDGAPDFRRKSKSPVSQNLGNCQSRGECAKNLEASCFVSCDENLTLPTDSVSLQAEKEPAEGVKIGAVGEGVSEAVTSPTCRVKVGTERKLDLPGASEMNRLYPNSRRETEKEPAEGVKIGAVGEGVSEAVTSPTCRVKVGTERKLDLPGASEMNRLYPNSRRESIEEDKYLNTLPRREGVL